MIQSVLGATVFVLLSCECFRVLQSTGYRPQRGYWKIVLTPYFLTLAVLAAGVYFLQSLSEYYCILAELALAAVWIFVKKKSPLKITKRIVRIAAAQFVLSFLLCYFVGNGYFALAMPLLTLAAFYICLPVDALINAYYLNKARKKLKNSSVKVVAVTGSYGKTTVKDMLSSLLENSVSPKGSCNTPLGIARFLNSTDLSGYRYLVLEFGARKKGDISELCKLYAPECGIVTGVCAQHLSTFKTFDNVVKTKRELVESLPENGFCILNAHDEIAQTFSDSGVCKKILSDDGLFVEAVRTDPGGTEANVVFGGKTYRVKFPHVSKHVTATAEMCIRACIALDQDISTTISRIVYVKQTEHRQEMSYNGHFYIMDDSYNGSIVGVKSCCETLKGFDCKKVAISQGLVECGKKRREMNVECGKLLGEVCDRVVILGKNSKFLSEGLTAAGCEFIKVKNLGEAVSIAREYVCGGILLFQNDLPDVAGL